MSDDNCPSSSIMALTCWRYSNWKQIYIKNLTQHFPTCCAYSVKKPIEELNLERTLDEDTGVSSFFFSFLSSSSPLGQTAVSGNSTLHQ